ncbi:TetR/AcrR family transcriptional regulator [Kitasatospora sp. SUK 42]|uniref:TetR/AcrR family transcriptional regulator n=1 Tax=Kitasatospora sp. SUK 42 TaxID=1588882 RepID=UPI0018CBC822|nr:TetR/AcrR family transcriptional regulator [Kitasatospora sp. SUK 42]MBV2151896.1 TetR/AcrR family transcriptional regulator [Kitasatospora sp. SUK 42]
MPASQAPTGDNPTGSDDRDKPQVSLWERLARPAPTPRTTLTPHRIAEAAVAIADTEGLDAVTMRRLATALGVAPMAAYRYVSGKDELIELMVDFAYGQLPLDTPADSWREAMHSMAVHLRAMNLAHPWTVRAGAQWTVRAATQFFLSPNQLAVPERAFAALAESGLDADTTMAVFRTVSGYVHGSVAAEIALQTLRGDNGWSDGDETRAGLAPRMSYLMGTGRYPNYQHYLHQATRKDDPDWQFETGLACVLDGIAAHFGI